MKTSPPGHTRRLPVAWWWTAAAAAAVALGFVGWREAKSTAEVVADLRPVPLTSYPGVEDNPSFSPDGEQFAFSWNGQKQDNYGIYVKLIGAGAPLRLTTDPAPDVRPNRMCALNGRPMREASLLSGSLDRIRSRLCGFPLWAGPNGE